MKKAARKSPRSSASTTSTTSTTSVASQLRERQIPSDAVWEPTAKSLRGITSKANRTEVTIGHAVPLRVRPTSHPSLLRPIKDETGYVHRSTT
jgi:hypothetical protein